MSQSTKPKLRVTVESVNPDKAKKYLKLNDNIRKPNRRKIIAMAADMKADDWESNGAVLRFQSDGKGGELLKDGQNKLLAVVASGTTQVFVCIRGIEGSDYVDIGEKRTMSQLLRHEGIPYAGNVASAIGNMLTYQRAVKADYGVHATQSERIHTFEKNRKELLKVCPMVHNTRFVLWKATIAAVFVMAPRPANYPAAKEDFLECLATGALGDEGLLKTDACYALRELQTRARRTQLTYTTRHRIALTVKAWNYHKRQMLMPTENLTFIDRGPTKEKWPTL